MDFTKMSEGELRELLLVKYVKDGSFSKLSREELNQKMIEDMKDPEKALAPKEKKKGPMCPYCFREIDKVYNHDIDYCNKKYNSFVLGI